MHKLTKSQRKRQRKKIKTSLSAENKLLKIIKNILKVKFPKQVTLPDVINRLNNINYNKLNSYIDKYANSVLRTNRKGFQNIYKALVQGKSGNDKSQKQLNIGFQSLMQEQNIYQPILAKFKYNLSLIKTIPWQAAQKLQEGYEQGVSFRGTDVEKFLQQTLGKRAKLIIRTESSKVNSALTEIRAKNLGINAYIWSTSEDRRVRDSHKAMDGVLVFWSTKLTLDKMTGHAGEYPNCRCVALPVVSLDDIQFPIKVAEGNLNIESKYVRGSHGKKYNTRIISGQIKEYNKQQFLAKYKQYF